MAQAQRQWAQARDYFLKGGEITAEFKDEDGLGITLGSLARLWQASGDGGLPASVASVLEVSPREAEEILRAALGGEKGNQQV